MKDILIFVVAVFCMLGLAVLILAPNSIEKTILPEVQYIVQSNGNVLICKEQHLSSVCLDLKYCYFWVDSTQKVDKVLCATNVIVEKVNNETK